MQLELHSTQPKGGREFQFSTEDLVYEEEPKELDEEGEENEERKEGEVNIQKSQDSSRSIQLKKIRKIFKVWIVGKIDLSKLQQSVIMMEEVKQNRGEIEAVVDLNKPEDLVEERTGNLLKSYKSRYMTSSSRTLVLGSELTGLNLSQNSEDAIEVREGAKSSQRSRPKHSNVILSSVTSIFVFLIFLSIVILQAIRLPVYNSYADSAWLRIDLQQAIFNLHKSHANMIGATSETFFIANHLMSDHDSAASFVEAQEIIGTEMDALTEELYKLKSSMATLKIPFPGAKLNNVFLDNNRGTYNVPYAYLDTNLLILGLLTSMVLFSYQENIQNGRIQDSHSKYTNFSRTVCLFLDGKHLFKHLHEHSARRQRPAETAKHLDEVFPGSDLDLLWDMAGSHPCPLCAVPQTLRHSVLTLRQPHRCAALCGRRPNTGDSTPHRSLH